MYVQGFRLSTSLFTIVAPLYGIHFVYIGLKVFRQQKLRVCIRLVKIDWRTSELLVVILFGIPFMPTKRAAFGETFGLS